jgi:hypothetical protein
MRKHFNSIKQKKIHKKSMFRTWIRIYNNARTVLSDFMLQMTPPEATSLGWKISVFGKSQGSALAC